MAYDKKVAEGKNKPQQDKTNKGTGGGGSNKKDGKKPEVPKQGAYLRDDAIFQQAKNDIGNAWADYRAKAALARGRTKGDFKTARDAIKLQAGRDRETMAEDFASRGMGSSGASAQTLEKYNTDVNEQLRLAKQAKRRSLADIGHKIGKGRFSGDLGSQRNLMNTQIGQARLDALLRRIQQYNLKDWSS